MSLDMLDEEHQRRMTRTNGAPQRERDGWDEPVPIGHTDLPAFPVDALPEPLRAWVAAEAEATQTPVDLAAFCALGTIAAATQKKAVVEVRPGWKEPLGLYLMAALPPGSRKSAVFSDATRPLVEIEADEARRLAPEVAQAKALREVAEKRLKRSQDDAAKAAPDGRDRAEAEVRAAVEALENIKLPASPKWIVDDVTPEGLVGVMKDAGGRIAIMSAEGGVVGMMNGRYSDGVANLDVYLKGHAGETHRVHRVNRPSEHVTAATLTLCLAVQPEVLSGLERHKGRGLPARFLYSLPDDLVGRRRDDTRPVPDGLAARYRSLVRTLVELPVTHDDEGEIASKVIEFTDEARDIIRDYHDELEPRLGGDLYWLADWGSKLRGALARIATLLHIVEAIERGSDWLGPVEEESMQRALLLAPYLIAHSQAAHGEMGVDPERRHARAIARALARHDEPTITARDILRLCRWLDADGRDAALPLLIEHGYLKPLQAEQDRGRPSYSYAINPAVRS